MGRRNPRVDAYIAQSAGFARPILEHLRDVVHDACPSVEEEMKWRCPHFMYHGMLCSMASFAEHCTFSFWKESLIVGEEERRDGAMGQFGCLRHISDLPSKRALTGYIKKGMRLNEKGVTVPRAKPRARRDVAIPIELQHALGGNKQALATFEGFSPSAKREYCEWIAEAKTEGTRQRRLETALEWMAEGKPRNWKYMKRS
ncbi:MAG TPA: YdeI/OmpD-associated family protein [Gemmatimonadaceae bacterium]|nr:YdeI/OmpD-associated family protein [Gemmatimonadaceae bacterium]